MGAWRSVGSYRFSGGGAARGRTAGGKMRPCAERLGPVSFLKFRTLSQVVMISAAPHCIKDFTASLTSILQRRDLPIAAISSSTLSFVELSICRSDPLRIERPFP